MDPSDLPTKEELQRKTPGTKRKIGISFAIMNNFKGAIETLESVKTMHDIQLYLHPQWRHQIPLAAAWNKTAKMAFADGCDYALVCNDDILFAPDTIDAMVREYERLRSEKVIMVTPNNIKGELADPYHILEYALPEGTVTSFSDHPNFSCFLIAPEYFTEIGDFDENFWPAWFEDNDSHRRAKLLGYREICTTAAPMVHFGGVSTSMMDNPDSSGSRDYYIKKWGGVPWPESEVFTTPYNDPNLTPKDWLVGGPGGIPHV